MPSILLGGWLEPQVEVEWLRWKELDIPEIGMSNVEHIIALFGNDG